MIQGGPDLMSWFLKMDRGDLKPGIFLLALKEQSAVLWGDPCVKARSAASRSPQWARLWGSKTCSYEELDSANNVHEHGEEPRASDKIASWPHLTSAA